MPQAFAQRMPSRAMSSDTTSSRLRQQLSAETRERFESSRLEESDLCRPHPSVGLVCSRANQLAAVFVPTAVALSSGRSIHVVARLLTERLRRSPR